MADIKTPQVGEIWLCKKDVVMNVGKEIAYIKGREYKCEINNCLTDEQNDKRHEVYAKKDAPIKWLNRHFTIKQYLKQEDVIEEIEKCRSNPYYFATKYLTVDGKPFTTLMTEREFNKDFFILQKP